MDLGKIFRQVTSPDMLEHAHAGQLIERLVAEVAVEIHFKDIYHVISKHLPVTIYPSHLANERAILFV